MNAESYGFVRRGSFLVSEVLISKPDGLPDPCMCVATMGVHAGWLGSSVASTANAREVTAVKILSLNEHSLTLFHIPDYDTQ